MEDIQLPRQNSMADRQKRTWPVKGSLSFSLSLSFYLTLSLSLFLTKDSGKKSCCKRARKLSSGESIRLTRFSVTYFITPTSFTLYNLSHSTTFLSSTQRDLWRRSFKQIATDAERLFVKMVFRILSNLKFSIREKLLRKF